MRARAASRPSPAAGAVGARPRKAPFTVALKCVNRDVCPRVRGASPWEQAKRCPGAGGEVLPWGALRLGLGPGREAPSERAGRGSGCVSREHHACPGAAGTRGLAPPTAASPRRGALVSLRGRGGETRP